MSDKVCPCIQECTVHANEEKIFNIFSGFMLIYVNQGTGTFFLNNERFSFTPGTVVIMTCLDYLRKELSFEDTQLTVLTFSETAFSGRIPEFFSIRKLPLHIEFKENRKKPEILLHLMSTSMKQTSKNNDIFMRNLSKELLIYTIKNCDSDITNPVHDVKTELALLYIYEHFKESISIESVAAHVHYSANYFYHSFQKNIGTTFQRFLHNLRMDYARNLMWFTDLSISEICYECGYNSAQYFSTAFRKRFGKSPKNYKNEVNIKEQHK